MTRRIGFLIAVQLLLCVPVFALQDPADNNASIQPSVSQQDIDLLRRRIEDEGRSNLEIVSQYHNETGDLNSRLD